MSIYINSVSLSVFKDVNTPQPFVEDLSEFGDDGSSQRASKADHVYLDAMGFGMGCSCLQMTFQACNIREARHLYDQLTPLTPVLVSHDSVLPTNFIAIQCWQSGLVKLVTF